jgi:hypothetical protein
MPPTEITLTLLAATVLIFGSFNYFHKNPKKKKENLFLKLSREGSANNLVFCSQEILQNKVIGIDGIHRKIMILERSRKDYNCSVIALDEVQNCELVSSCGALNSENLKNLEIEKKPHAIELQFAFKDQAQRASIIFYDSLINSKRELVLLKAKAEFWKVMLSKLLTSQVQQVRA